MGYLRAVAQGQRRNVGAVGGIGGLVRAGARAVGRVTGSRIGRLALGATGGAGAVAGAALGAITSRSSGGAVGGQIHPSGILPGGRPFITRRDVLFDGGREAPRGYHLNKADGKYGPKGTYFVRNRRMNPMNGRAAARAIRRINSAEKMLRRIFVVQGKGQRRVKPKTTRRK